MDDRSLLLENFLLEQNLQKAELSPISSDASFRRYIRVRDGKSKYILMDAPPDKEEVEPFINIDRYLCRLGVSAPEIFSQDIERGFLLLEDLGDYSYSNVLSGDSELSEHYDEYMLYEAAVDVLIHLGRSELPSKLPDYHTDLLMKEVSLLIQWYLPNVTGALSSQDSYDEYLDIWRTLLNIQNVSSDVVVLRDYHADNLMWLPQRDGLRRVGVLDFQDAVIGSPVYDLVSLLEDARRDVAHDTVNAVIDYYLDERKSIDSELFHTHYAIFAAQRNCKIIGIFARLAVRDKKPRYLEYMQRVWRHLDHDLRHPVLAPLKTWFDDVMTKEMRDTSCFNKAESEQTRVNS